MTLKARINEDVKAAMRARNAKTLGTLRLLLAAIKQRDVYKRQGWYRDARERSGSVTGG